MQSLLSAEVWVALFWLVAMEIVLGIDNVVFVSILVGRVPAEVRERTRRLGISLALVFRLGLLFALTWLMGLTQPLFAVLGKELSGRDLILLVGGLFLIGKASHETYQKLEGEESVPGQGPTASASAALAQIVALDIVFSLDSVITAVGMAQQLWIMVTAMVISMLVMLASARGIGAFIERHPSLKILALSFLLLIGVLLVADAIDRHIPRGYLYFAMAFSMLVEALNMRYRKKTSAVTLHHQQPT